MAWLRIDDRFTEHAKLVQLDRADRWTWMEVLTYCARQRSGTVPTGISDVLKHVTEAFLEKCKTLGLLDEKRGVLSVHDWDAYNPKDRTAAERMARMRDRNSAVTATVTETAPRPVPSPTRNNVDEELRPLIDAGWNTAQLTAASVDKERALAWLEQICAQPGVRNIAALSWSAFSGGGWPHTDSTPEPVNISSSLSKTCPDCGETYGVGHLEDCPVTVAARQKALTA